MVLQFSISLLIPIFNASVSTCTWSPARPRSEGFVQGNDAFISYSWWEELMSLILLHTLHKVKTSTVVVMSPLTALMKKYVWQQFCHEKRFSSVYMEAYLLVYPYRSRASVNRGDMMLHDTRTVHILLFQAIKNLASLSRPFSPIFVSAHVQPGRNGLVHETTWHKFTGKPQ